MKIEVEILFDFGDRVIYANKIGKDEGFVTCLKICGDEVMYGVTWSDKKENYHYWFELEKK